METKPSFLTTEFYAMVAAIVATTALLLLTGARNESEVFRWADGLAQGERAGHGVIADAGPALGDEVAEWIRSSGA